MTGRHESYDESGHTSRVTSRTSSYESRVLRVSQLVLDFHHYLIIMLVFHIYLFPF